MSRPVAAVIKLYAWLSHKAVVQQISTWCQYCEKKTKVVYLVLHSADSPVLTSRVAVTVHVLDINEFPPELASPYETFVCENAKVGQVPSLLTYFSVQFRSSMP